MHRTLSLSILTTLVLSLVASPLVADEIESRMSLGAVAAYYIDNNKGWDVPDGGFVPPSYAPIEPTAPYSLVDDGRNLGSGWGGAEAEVTLTQSWIIPFLQMPGALFEGNNLKVDIRGALNPVAVRTEFQAQLTPIAFLNFFAGGSVATGWSVAGLNGIALNEDFSGELIPTPLQGAVLKAWVGGTFQFDFAALFPGEWNHVVVVASPRLEYQHFTAAETGQAWQTNADAGENFNAFKFKATYFLGYQMPLFINTAGFLVDTSSYMSNESPMGEGWGSDFTEVIFGPLANFTLTDTSSLAVLFQFRTVRGYTADTVHASWFQNRVADRTLWEWYRVAFNYTLRL